MSSRTADVARLCAGPMAIAAFVAAGFARLCFGLPFGVYLGVGTTAFVAFAVSVLWLPDEAPPRTASARTAGVTPPPRSPSPSPHVHTEVTQ